MFIFYKYYDYAFFHNKNGKFRNKRTQSYYKTDSLFRTDLYKRFCVGAIY